MKKQRALLGMLVAPFPSIQKLGFWWPGIVFVTHAPMRQYVPDPSIPPSMQPFPPLVKHGAKRHQKQNPNGATYAK
jgi:hypothetical protein